MSRSWVICQHGKPLVVILDEAEARREFGYLSFHGVGYTLTETPVEPTAGDYATLDGPSEVANVR